VSLALQGLLSVTPCQLTVSSSLSADNQDLSLELNQSCRSPHLSGTLRHSFPELRSQGLPQIVNIEATAPEGPEQAGALFIKVGTCNIRASRVIEARERAQWLWALESKCPVLWVGLYSIIHPIEYNFTLSFSVYPLCTSKVRSKRKLCSLVCLLLLLVKLTADLLPIKGSCEWLSVAGSSRRLVSFA